MRGRSARSAAAAVDATYDLKDRAVSAVAFLGRVEKSPIHELQVADADQHIQGVDPQRVVPFRMPAMLPFGAVAAALALGLLLWPRPPAVQARPAEPMESIVAAAEQAEESLEDLDEAADKYNDPKLKELVQKLTNAVEQMKQPGVDVKEALAKLSEMQAAIAAQQATFNVGLVDTQMQALGEALASTESLDGAGQSLQLGQVRQGRRPARPGRSQVRSQGGEEPQGEALQGRQADGRGRAGRPEHRDEGAVRVARVGREQPELASRS